MRNILVLIRAAHGQKQRERDQRPRRRHHGADGWRQCESVVAPLHGRRPRATHTFGNCRRRHVHRSTPHQCMRCALCVCCKFSTDVLCIICRCVPDVGVFVFGSHGFFMLLFWWFLLSRSCWKSIYSAVIGFKVRLNFVIEIEWYEICYENISIWLVVMIVRWDSFCVSQIKWEIAYRFLEISKIEFELMMNLRKVEKHFFSNIQCNWIQNI